MKGWTFLFSTGLIAIPAAAFAQSASAPQTSTTTAILPGETSQASVASSTAPPGDSSADIVVTAQRRSERLKDVPLTITALSSNELRKSGVTNLSDLQNTVSGLNFGGVGNVVLPAIRGVSTGVTSGGGENPNSLYVDGVYYAQAHLLNATLPDVDRVEVLKGPQGTLFGRNSVGGAIRVFTKDPTFTPTADVTIEGGSFAGSGSGHSPHIAARAFVGMPIVDQLLAASVSASYDYTDGFLKNAVSGGTFGKILRANARGKLLITPSSNLRVVLSAHYLKDIDDGLLGATPINGLSVASNFPSSIVPTQPYHVAFDSGLGIDFIRSPVREYGYSGVVDLSLEGLGTLTSTTGYSDTLARSFTTIAWARGSATCLATFACIDYSYEARNKAFSQELNFSSEKFGIFRLTAGLFYYHETLDLEGRVQASIIQNGVAATNGSFDIHSYAAYGQAEADISDRLSLIVGGRYTHEPHNDSSTVPTVISRSQTFNSFIPRVSLKYVLAPSVNVYATFSQGEKTGLTGVSNNQSNPRYAPVTPEKLTSYEIGAKFAHQGMTANIAVFYYNYKNKQEQVFTGTAGFIQNTGPVRLYGLDADASVKMSSDLALRSNVTWVPVAKYLDFPNASGYSLSRNANGSFQQITFDATGYRLLRAPRVTANISTDYTHAVARGLFDANVTLAYSSSVFHDYLVKQSAYTTLNARIGYTLPNSRVRIGLYAKNITDKAYIAYTYVSAGSISASYSRPREIGASLSFSQ